MELTHRLPKHWLLVRINKRLVGTVGVLAAVGAIGGFLGGGVFRPPVVVTTTTTVTTPPTTGAISTSVANVFMSANGSDTGTNCKLFTSQVANPDPTGASLCLTQQKAYLLARPGDLIMASCAGGNWIGDDFTISYDSTKAGNTNPVTLDPSSTCPTQTIVTGNGQQLTTPMWTLGAHTITSAQFTNTAGGGNTIPVNSTTGFKTPGKIYIGWDTYDTCTGQTATSFTGCTESISQYSIIWNAGTDIKQGSFNTVGASFLTINGLHAYYNMAVDQDHPGGKSCPTTVSNPHAASNVIFNNSWTSRFFSNGANGGWSNSQIGPDNSTNNAKLSSYCRDPNSVAPFCGQTGGTCVYTPNTNNFLNNVNFTSMNDAGCNVAATQAAFPSEGNQFCHNECLYLSDTINLSGNADWLHGCSIISLFCSDDIKNGVNFTFTDSIFELPSSNASNTINCHTDTSGVTTTQKFINDDVTGSVIFQSNSGGKVNLTWANNVGVFPQCTNTMYNSLIFTNNVTFSAPGSCAVNNVTSTNTAEWVNYIGGNFALNSTAQAVDHASPTYAPTIDSLNVAQCGSAPDAGPREYCVPFTGASLATCTGGTCSQGTAIGSKPGSCSSTATPTGSGIPSGGWVMLGNMTDGVMTKCRWYPVYIPNGLAGSAPVVIYAHGNEGCLDDLRDESNLGLDALANTNKFILIQAMLPFQSSGVPSNDCHTPTDPTGPGTGDRPSANWFHPNRDTPDPGTTVPQDYTYIQTIISDIKARLTGSLTVDPKRIWFIGQSSGGGFGEGVACDDTTSALFRGVTVQSLWDVSATGTSPNYTAVPLSERCGGGSSPVSTNTNFFFQFFYAMNAINAPNGNCLAAPNHCSASYADISQYMSNRWACTSSAHLVSGSNSNVTDTYTCPTGGYRGVLVPGSGDGFNTDFPKGYTMQSVFDYFNNATWTGP